MCCGRLAGAEMARSEWYRKGRVPLHTLRADIDYGTKGAKTKYGMIGVQGMDLQRRDFRQGYQEGTRHQESVIMPPLGRAQGYARK